MRPEVGVRSGESEVVRTSLLREGAAITGNRVDDDDIGAGEGEDKGSDDVNRFGLRGLSVGLNMERSLPPLVFLGDFDTLTLDGFRPGEKRDNDVAFGPCGEGERGKRDGAKRAEVLALGASGGEEGGLGRHSEGGCGCDRLPRRYVVLGSSDGRSVSESDIGSKKSDGS